jgi:hypothetical protein
MKLSELSGNIRYITLDANILVGNVAILKSYKNRIYICDDVAEQFLCFSIEDGKHVFTLDRRGQGPGEFVSAHAFSINEYLQCIEIPDWGNRKIIRFSLDGDFISEQQISFFGACLEAIDSNQYIVFTNYTMNNDESNNVLLLNKDYTIHKQYLPFDKKLRNLSFFYPVRLLPQGNHWLLSLPFSYQIYSISAEGAEIAYSLDFGGNEIDNQTFDLLIETDSPLERIKSQKRFFDRLGTGKSCWNVSCFYDSEQITGFQFEFQKKHNWFLRSKKRSQDLIISQLADETGRTFDGMMLYFSNNQLFAIENSMEMETTQLMVIDLSDF